MDATGSNTSWGQLQETTQEGLVSVEIRKLTVYIIEGGIPSILTLVGIAGNLLSVIVFYRMGYQETMNISMTFICAVDLIRCGLGFIFYLKYPLELISVVLSETWDGIGEVTVSFPSLVGGYISGVLAAYVSVERCLCVSIPFSVKYLLTPSVVWITNVVIILVVLGSMLVFYTCYTFAWVFNPDLNATVAVQALTPLFYAHPEMNTYMNVIGIGWLLLSFCVICICTGIISYQLYKASKFKSSANQNDSKGNGLSSRDKQVIKMLLAVILVYIVANLLRILMFVGRAVFVDFDLLGKEQNLFQILSSITDAIDFVNPAVNVFIFYTMSSQFKESLKRLLFRSTKNIT